MADRARLNARRLGAGRAATSGVRPPLSTYRLQLHAGFRFEDAARVLPYLARLGASHLYLSPIFQARAGSTHGYDVTDHTRVNEELGGEAGFHSLVAAARQHGLGIVLDVVSNHVGIGKGENARWLDVLEYGRASPFVGFFDVDWEPAKAELRGKVLLPFLGDHYGRVLEQGELRLGFDAERGSLHVDYFEHRFPLAPRSYPLLLGGTAPRRRRAAVVPAAPPAELEPVLRELGALARVRGRAALRARSEDAKRALAEATTRHPAALRWVEEALARAHGAPGETRSWRTLHRVLEAQAFRLAYWRVAADEINYRRFFNINDLAGLRIERREVFERVHELVFRLVEQGDVDGLRIDHVDGLFDPRTYCERLARRFPRRGLYVVVEKILAPHEQLRPSWPVAGTTGYDFLALVNGLFVDPAGEAPLAAAYRELAGVEAPFDDVVYHCKKHVMNFLLGSELQVLATELDRISEQRWDARDFTLTSLKEALKEVVACFPVYRSYVTRRGADPEDRRDIEWAVEKARRRSSDPETSLFDFLHAVLTTDLVAHQRPSAARDAVLRFAMKLQQYTGPVAAKGMEDTAFYRHHRLLSLNEVGSDPRRFGGSVAALHRTTRERARRHPYAMLATSTHDTKRGEDARLRIDVLSELPEEWRMRVQRWMRINRTHKRSVGERLAPAPNDEYLLYQTLVGAWPRDGGDGIPAPDALAALRQRVCDYAIKALREGKESSSWRAPDESYEAATLEFLNAVLDAERSSPFLPELDAFARRVDAVARVSSLAQLVLKLTVPGVPDFYQGSELWDLSLADPDNRRPVDFGLREALLDALVREPAAGLDRRAPAPPGLERVWDARTKLLVATRLLHARRRHPALFLEGDYVPLPTEGASAERLVAFARRHGRKVLVVAVPRLVAPLMAEDGAPPVGAVWSDTLVRMPPELGDGPLRDALTERERATHPAADGSVLSVSTLFDVLPVAALVREG